jgi:drug/metabolite transporter (DMT)-like permease
MTKPRVSRRRFAWRPLIAALVLIAVWVSLVLWGEHYWMPREYSNRVRLWSVAAVFGAILGLLVWINLRKRRGSAPALKRGPLWFAIVGASVGGALFLGMALGAVLLICNGVFRSDQPFIVDGTVVSKYSTSGRSTTYTVVVETQSPPRQLSFGFNQDAFQRVQPGDHFHEELQVGFFGWPCRPR